MLSKNMLYVTMISEDNPRGINRTEMEIPPPGAGKSHDPFQAGMTKRPINFAGTTSAILALSMPRKETEKCPVSIRRNVVS